MLDLNKLKISNYDIKKRIGLAYTFNKRSSAIEFSNFCKANNIKWSNGWEVEWDMRFNEENHTDEWICIENHGTEINPRFVLRRGTFSQFNFKELKLIKYNY